MCIAYIDFDPRRPAPLYIAANRDEFHQRPTQPIHLWPDHPGLLAGRDLEAGGTWLGIHLHTHRFALVTNYREPNHPTPPNAISRGHLVQNFLIGTLKAADYLKHLQQQAHRYAGFNLIVGDDLISPHATLWYYSNRSPEPPRSLAAGRYVLSNHLLDTPWPKANRLKQNMIQALQAPTMTQQLENSLKALNDRRQDSVHCLPHTGLSLDREQLLSSIFIVSPDYGTRCSTVLIMSAQNKGLLSEQSYTAQGHPTDRIDWPLQFSLNNG